MALNSQGTPGISYYDFNNTNLKYAYWTGTNWDVQTVDDQGFNGLHTSVAFDSKDNPHISYFGENGGLKYAVWNGTAWSLQKVDVAGSFTSIAIDSNDYPHISYFSIQNGSDLKYAAWNGTSWELQTSIQKGERENLPPSNWTTALCPHKLFRLYKSQFAGSLAEQHRLAHPNR